MNADQSRSEDRHNRHRDVSLERAESGERARLPRDIRESIETSLRHIAERLRAGDRSLLANARPPGFRPKLYSGQGGHHYLLSVDGQGMLVDERFAWWDAVPPGQGCDPLRDICSTDQDRSCEFFPPLTTIVGSRLASVAGQGNVTPGMSPTDWESLGNGQPNRLMNAPFVIRESLWEFPLLVEQEVITEGQRQPVVVLRNDYAHLGPTGSAPSLFIDFFEPQRAVELEFGYTPFPGREQVVIHGHNVLLFAYDKSGQLVARSNGGQLNAVLGAPVVLTPSLVDYRIGVRDFGGNITTVELRFTTTDDGIPITESALVLRVWLEALPPAAVKQDTLQVGQDLPLRLPFHCDRHVALLRGFRLEFIDGQPHLLQTISVDLDSRTEADGSITLLGSAELDAPDNSAADATLYYTVVAWDSRQMEVLTTDRFTTEHPQTDETITVELDDPCPLLGQLSGSCGPLFGALEGWRISINGGRAEESEHFLLFWDIPFRPGPPEVDWSLTRNIQWEDDDVAYRWGFSGQVLTGRSLIVNSIPAQGLAVQVAPPRDDPNAFLYGPDRTFGLWPAMQADLAFLGLTYFYADADGPFRQLDVEVKGTAYDGQVMKWEIGCGVASEAVGSGETHACIGFPVFGGLKRRLDFARPRVAIQNLRFGGVPVGFAGMPVQFGALLNIGDSPVLVSSVTRSGADQNIDLGLLLPWVGSPPRHLGNQNRRPFPDPPFPPFPDPDRHGWYFLEVAGTVPLGPWVLYPGQAILVGGRFASQDEQLHDAGLDFQTNDQLAVDTEVVATGRGLHAAPGGDWIPDHYDLGRVDSGQTVIRHALVESTAPETPLVITQLGLAHGTRGYRITRVGGPGNPPPFAPLQPFQYLLGPGQSLLVEITYQAPRTVPPNPNDPPHPLGGDYTETLFAETNDGRKEFPLSAQPWGWV
jgi:hypothetical protein